VTSYKEKSPSQQLNEVGPTLGRWHKYTKRASSRSQIWVIIEDSAWTRGARVPESPLGC